MSAAYIQVHFWLDFIVNANTMYPDQTAREQSDLGTYCYNIGYQVPKNRADNKVLTGGQRVN